MTCRAARAAILGVVRGGASEADRLRLERHLDRCTGCRAERSRSLLLERVRDLPVRHLGDRARGRVLAAVLAEAHGGDAMERPGQLAPPVMTAARRWPVPLALAAALVLALGAGARGLLVSSGAAATVAAQGQTVRAERAGTLRLAGAQVWYGAGSAVRLSDERRVDLLQGEIEVEVKPGGPGRFRVVTPRFVVEVLGTRFIVREAGVATTHGTVRVLDRSGRVLAIVRAGESWRAEPRLAATAGATQAATGATLTGATRVGATLADATQVGATQVGATQVGALRLGATVERRGRASRAARLLADAQVALVEHRFELARARIRAALDASPTLQEQTTAELYRADVLLGEQRYDEAVAAYRRAAWLGEGSAEGELAAFACAQVISERAAAPAARAALVEYLTRFPDGHFHREATDRLARLPGVSPAP